MSLRGNRLGIVDRTGLTAELRPWLAGVREAALMLSLVAGVCLSWPQVARSMVLASKIAYYYCFSPR